MAGKKDYAVAIVVAGLTDKQATTIVAETMRTKTRVAPESRGTAVKGTQKTIGRILQSKAPQINQK